MKPATHELEPGAPDAVGTALVANASRLSDLGLFMKKFFKKGLTISSLVPSSPAIGSMLLAHVDFQSASTIVELGAGTGAVTEQIVERLRPHNRFVACESDPDFCRVLRRRFPGMTLIHGDVGDIARPLTGMGIGQVDCVISGLPTPNLPRRSLARMMSWLRTSLAPDGLFLQITEVPYFYQRFYDRLFDSVDFQMVLLNLPPGGIYRCRSPRTRTVERAG